MKEWMSKYHQTATIIPEPEFAEPRITINLTQKIKNKQHIENI